VEKAIETSTLSGKKKLFSEYESAVAGKSNYDAREAAKALLGEEVIWDWDRT
jgi:isocitrate lyase